MNQAEKTRYELEEEIRTLASQCKCYHYSGPCRFCLKMEKLERQADRMDAEDEVVAQISEWLKSERFLVFRDREVIDAVAFGLAAKEWKKRPAQT